jgi:hypothetical protein
MLDVEQLEYRFGSGLALLGYGSQYSGFASARGNVRSLHAAALS